MLRSLGAAARRAAAQRSRPPSRADAPGFQIAHLRGFLGRIDRHDGAVAGAERARFGLGVAVDADDCQRAGFDRFRMRSIWAPTSASFMKPIGGLAPPRASISASAARRRGFQFFGLGVDDMAAIKYVLEFEQIGLISEDLLQAQRPLLVPGPRQTHRLVPGGQLQGAAARPLGQRHGERFDQDAIDIVFRLRLGQAERIDLHAIAKQQRLGIGDAIARRGRSLPRDRRTRASCTVPLRNARRH